MTSAIISSGSELTPKQSRAARALLGWTQQDLAERTKLATSTVADFERGKRTPMVPNIDALKAAFDSAGIRFVADGIQGPSPTNDQDATLADGSPIRLIDATDLSQWATRNDAKSAFPELIERLILATTGNLPKRIQFPSGDSVQQPGWDGICEQHITDKFDWLPWGTSGWELGTQGGSLLSKAEEDHTKRKSDALGLIQSETTFVFATPRRWKAGAKWSREKRSERIWKDVRVLDADDLAQWLALFPAVGYWFAARIGKFVPGTMPVEEVWREWRLSTEWPLSTELLLSGRDQDAIELLKWLYGNPGVHSIQGDSVGEGIAFLYAAIDLLPEPYKKLFLSRCLFASSPESARALGMGPSRKVIVIEASEPGLAARLSQQGHHVLVVYGSHAGTTDLVNVLRRPQFELFQEALERMGIPEVKAVALTRDSARKISVLRRLIPSNAASVLPSWAEGERGRLLLAALFAGAWDDGYEGDRSILESLSGEKYGIFSARLPGWIDFPDAPMRHAGNNWKVASPYDAWFRLAGLISKQDLETFVAAAREVLGSADPRFDMDSDERWYAGTRGQLPKYSPWLVSGMTETLLLLAMFGRQVRAVSGAEDYSDRIVRELLWNADERRWWSLSSEMRTLAEISPEVFLSSVEHSLSREDPPVMVLFKEDNSPFTGRAYHSHLLWALETLAWSPEHLGRVAELLARLSILDPGGRYANRPDSSLRSIFLLWLPQTNATFSQRFKVIDRLREIEPAAAWKLMLSIYPKGYDSSSYNPRPKWRDFEVTQPEIITNRLIFEGANRLAERLLADAGADQRHWPELIEHVAGFSPEWRERAWTALEELSGRLNTDNDRLATWTALRGLLCHHRAVPHADWALPEEELERVQRIYELFSPADPVSRCTWMFSHGTRLMEVPLLDNWQAHEQLVREKRAMVVGSLLRTSGFSGVRQLIARAQVPYLVGPAYVEADPSAEALLKVLRELREDDAKSIREFVDGLFAAGNFHLGWQWSESVLEIARDEKWSEAAITRLLLALPSECLVWKKAASFGESIRREYWAKANFFPRNGSADETLYAIAQMMGVGRACELVERLAGDLKGIPGSTIVQILEAAAGSDWPKEGNAAVMSQWGVAELLKALDADETIGDEAVARLEWMYLPLLEHSQRTPIVLHRFMAANPQFFVQVLSAIFRAHSESGSAQNTPTDHEKAIASQAYRLLSSWKTVPGMTASGMESDALVNWVTESHRLAVEAERGAVGDQYIGRILSYSPPGSDGAWPHEAVRGVIERFKNTHIENGLLIGVHNKRGVTSRGMHDGGALERELAKKYNDWADLAKIEWPHTSALLRQIARSFENDARHHDEQAERTDWEY